MLGNAAPTQFDLRFSVFGIPTRVHPLFWVFSAVMGWSPHDFNFTLVWIACVFVSILVHEIGHAFFATYFGWPAEIVLYLFGGYASFLPVRGRTLGRDIIVLLAGPGAGFVLYGIIWAAEKSVWNLNLFPDGPAADYLDFFFRQMKFINLWWGLVNLLPVYPLDGGQISRALFEHWRSRDGLETSLKLSLVVGGAAAFLFFKEHQTWPAVLFGMLAVQSLQHLQGMRY
jgi:Zn-dependent protease